MDPRFTVNPSGRYWIVTDTETGAQWPYTDEDAARRFAAKANTDATVMRSQIAAAPPETVAPQDDPAQSPPEQPQETP